MISSEWTPNQQNTILFVMIDANGVEVPGLGTTFLLRIRKIGGAFATGLGTKLEVGLGFYQYVATAAEADTAGPVAIVVTAAGAIQQNLEYVVGSRVIGVVSFTYTLTNTNTSLPIEGAKVWATTDLAGEKIVWIGDSDSNGIARDVYGQLPWLEPGAYYFWKIKEGYIFANQPDLENVA
jgi:hypothetical protein